MHYTIIVNPVSGYQKGHFIMEQITYALNENGIEFTSLLSEYNGHPYELVKEADLSNSQALIVIGGDGTMHEVVNGMLDREDKIKVPIGLIPGGTGNSLMHDLQTLEPMVALDAILGGEKLAIDIVEVKCPAKTLFAFNIIGWGLPVTINGLAEKMRLLKGQRYNIATILEIIRNPKWQVDIKVDGQTLSGKYAFFLACNTQYSGKGMKVAPPAKLNDGLIDLIILKSGPRWALLQLFSRIFSGNHISHPLIQHRQVKTFEIHPKKNTALTIDGQDTGNTPIRAKILPKEIEIFIPASYSNL